jgi:glutaredoxin-related protein
MQIPLKLYGTEFCHLCEQAHAIVIALGIDAEYVDIVNDDVLFEKYGVRIPVLQRLDSGDELGWPFDEAAVARFLGQVPD